MVRDEDRIRTREGGREGLEERGGLMCNFPPVRSVLYVVQCACVQYSYVCRELYGSATRQHPLVGVGCPDTGGDLFSEVNAGD